jgi:hypothetical protein
VFRCVVHLLLIGTLLACPLQCRLGICTSGDGARASISSRAVGCAACCCQQRQTFPGAGLLAANDCHSPERSPRDRAPCNDQCQCICGGAVAQRDEDSAQASPMRQAWEFAFADVDSIPATRACQTTITPALHPVRVCSGRWLCCRHMRWQC